MFVKEEYYINLYVGGKFVRDPHVSSGTLQDNLRVVWNNSITIEMLNYWVKCKEIDLYVEHEIDTTIFTADDLLLTAASVEGYVDGNQGDKGGEGVEGLNGEGVKVVGNKCGEVDAIDQGLDGLDASVKGSGDSNQGGEGVEVAGSKGGEVAGGLNSGVKEADEEEVKDESDNGDDEEELQEARKKLKEVDRKTNGKVKETVVDETENESSEEQIQAEVLEEVEGEGLNDRVSREEEGN
ncbi:hypothetical protein Gogos_012904 [Gossypium gossypioides]|uniref:Uncharacterized protein n=1 Tax=Gossypium gossypioides TaxID=34282 RepID=A0A7J9BU95_GOSGO|nr:hypothetical protein [Gossypium gossypioides]